eukprot:TRINITY_DN1439_c0_g1_i3.p1 TRINITY_DN1439_c0_g1~~TRINITY_DN1439_c0_g1_i3.p1  ORF type:complete len:209 (+),score=31.75 TRINITY_DN1439_c0_g1_i3:59-685(+)
MSTASKRQPAPVRRRPAAAVARRRGVQRVFPDKDCRRRARNLLPCSTETRACWLWDVYARGEPQPEGASTDLFELFCFNCGTEAGALGTRVEAELHTLSGTAKVFTCSWVSPNAQCKEVVRLDGSESCLFAYIQKTVYTRTLLDVILYTVIRTKSSIAAASAVSATELHCSGSVHANDSAQLRQELSHATDLYSHTHIVPRSLFKCQE